MAAYFVAQITITDHEEYGEYLSRFDAVFEKCSGEVIAVEDSPAIPEGNWRNTRFVMTRFPNEEALREWYAEKPPLFAPSTALLWDDEHISKGMLEAHLNPNIEAASRNPKTIDASVQWIDRLRRDRKLESVSWTWGVGRVYVP